MRATYIRRAASSAALPLSVSQASTQLIPPIPLYRRLLRAHRSLPPDMRFMGDSYVKSEFRLTKSTDNAIHIIGFLSQWKIYLDELLSAASAAQAEVAPGMKGEIDWKGRKLDVESFERMSKEQVGQLYELMHATKELWKSPEQLEQEARAAEDQSDIAGKSTTS